MLHNSDYKSHNTGKCEEESIDDVQSHYIEITTFNICDHNSILSPSLYMHMKEQIRKSFSVCLDNKNIK